MAINITNSIGQHKIPQRINKTETKHTDLSCHTGSCMAHLNCFPPRAAGVNCWFFIAVPFGGGCWYKAKCEMLLRKRDGERNVQNFGFVVQLRNGDGDDMLHDNGNCHGLAPSFFDDMTQRRRQNLAVDDQATLMVDRKPAIYVCLR